MTRREELKNKTKAQFHPKLGGKNKLMHFLLVERFFNRMGAIDS
jgi:hypothetical protein